MQYDSPMLKKHFLLSIITLIYLGAMKLNVLTEQVVFAQFLDNVDISLVADKESLTVGDPVQITLTIKHPFGYQALVPQFEETWGAFEIWSQSELLTQANDEGGQTTTQIILGTLFEVGLTQLPPFQVTLRDGDGELIERATPPLSLTVESVLTGEGEDLQGLKPQAGLPVPPLWPWIVLSALLLIALCTLLIWFYFRMRKHLIQSVPEISPPPVVDMRLPHEIALAELDRIEKLDLPGQGRFKEYYTLVTNCIRQYLSNEFEFPALDQTTDETKRALSKRLASKRDVLPDQVNEVTRLLEEGALVKFARFVPQVEEAYYFIPQMRQIIDLLNLEPEVAVDNTAVSSNQLDQADSTAQFEVKQ